MAFCRQMVAERACILTKTELVWNAVDIATNMMNKAWQGLEYLDIRLPVAPFLSGLGTCPSVSPISELCIYTAKSS